MVMILKDAQLKLIDELIKDSRRSGRELADRIGVSQPTATRLRTKLENSGFIQEFTAIPNFRKIGYELLVFTFSARGHVSNQYLRECSSCVWRVFRHLLSDVPILDDLVSAEPEKMDLP
jgi:DNA-binding Lrp family transcriptional regulator